MPTIRLGRWPVMVAPWPRDPSKITILFVHGASHCASFWTEQIKGLAAVANTMAVDLPGHGLNRAAGRERIQDYADWLLNFMTANLLENPVICGLSMGGAIAQYLLINHGDKFKGGILCNTGARLKVSPKIFDAIRNDYNGFVKLIYEFGTAEKNRSPILWQRLLSISDCRPDVALGDFRACDDFDVMDQLKEITRPVLVIAADQDSLTPPKYADFIAKRIAGARLATIDGAGHFAPLEKPEPVNQAIMDFIEEPHNLPSCPKA